MPVAFFPGATGVIYRQFALTIVFSILVSTFNAITGKPLQTALLLGFSPFVVVDVLTVAAAATLLPTAWRLLGRQSD